VPRRRGSRALVHGLLAIAARCAAVIAIAAVLVAVAPVAVVALAGAWTAWLRGWPPTRLYRAAAWCLPMLVVWLAGLVLTGSGVGELMTGPYRAWLAMWHDFSAGSYLIAIVVIAPAAIPVGLLAGGLAWSARLRAMATRAGGVSPASAITFDQRQWRHQVRTATARIAAPGSAPLLAANGDFVAGAVIRTVSHQAQGLTQLPSDRLRAHQLVVGASGTGKTTLLLRLWAAFMATGLSRHAAGVAGPPLVVVLDCKGGADARKIADRFRRVQRDAGARTVAIWPDEATLDLWSLPSRQLITTLVDLVEHGSGGAAYYTDVMDAVVALAVDAPEGPPASSADLLARLDMTWLAAAYSADGHDEQLQLVRTAAAAIPDIALRFRTLFRRLGSGLDGPGAFADADAWYCILEGTGEVPVAEVQARAVVDLLASYVIGPGAGTADPVLRRQVLLAVDEFSAVARRLPIWQLYERARSLGLAVQVSAQSWHGLAPTEDERYRIATAAEGGIWLLRTAHPEPITALAGQRQVMDTTRQLVRFPRWSRRGSSRLQSGPVADPAIVRALDVGQAAYLHRGGVTYTQVKRLVVGPAALTGAPTLWTAPAGQDRSLRCDRTSVIAGPRLPDVGPFLDEAFGVANASSRAHDASNSTSEGNR